MPCPSPGEREGVSVSGFAGLPTLHRPDAAQQFLFVNGRPVKDKLLIGAVRAAYGDLIPRGRHPLLALFVSLPPQEVDVNVHPAKVEVRFRDSGRVRSLLVNALAAALHAAGPSRLGRQRRLGAAGAAPQRGAVRASAGARTIAPRSAALWPSVSPRRCRRRST